MRQLFLIEIQGPTLSGFVHADIGDIGKPPARGFVQVLKTGEGSTIEEVLLQVPEGAFNFSLRLRVAGAAGNRAEAVIGSKSQKVWVVNRLFSLVATDHHLHVVVETIGSDALQIGEGRHMFANRCGEVLTFDKMHILAAAVSQDVAEGVDTTFAFGGEIDLVS